MTEQTRRRTLMACMGVGGIALAHVVDYLVVLPGGRQRAGYLAATGHGYWGAALALGALSGLLAVALAARRGWVNQQAPALHVRPFLAQLAPLAGGQMALFTLLELTERAAAGVGPGALLHTPTFYFGLLLQAVVAAVVLVVLAVVEALARRFAKRRAGPQRDRQPAHWRSRAFVYALRWWVGVGDPRAPPPLAHT